MALRIAAPDISPELRWIVSVLFDEYLGLDYCLVPGSPGRFVITLDAKRIEMPDIFFAISKTAWLQERSLPATAGGRLDIGKAGLDAAVVSAFIPVIYGDAGKSIAIDDELIEIPLDIFGAAFVMLSRYEEAVVTTRDMHDRFPANASLAWRHGITSRPIIDEYVEVLWSCIKRLWHGLERKRRVARNVVSCDVDHPYHASARSLPRLVRRSAGELLRKRSVGGAVKPVRNYFASRSGDWKNDPYYHTVDWIMDVNERAGNRVAFYFIPEITDPLVDGHCTITDSAVRAMLRRIAGRGHEIGIHPGYLTYRSEHGIARARRALEAVLEQEGVQGTVLGGRQHYLRWSTQTPRHWETARLEYDSTLGYAECGGFRCGTCHDYPMYDLHERRPLKIRQRPLVCMEVAVIDAAGLGLSESAADAMRRLKHAAHRVGGNFTLLWHNSSLESGGARDMYCSLIA